MKLQFTDEEKDKLEDGQWVHIVRSYNAPDLSQGYVNGESEELFRPEYTIPLVVSFLIGVALVTTGIMIGFTFDRMIATLLGMVLITLGFYLIVRYIGGHK